MEYHLGRLIRSIRKERELLGRDVTRGLTGVEKISRMEKGGKELGKWTSDTLLERLGMSANKFGCLFLEEELEACELRRELLAQLKMCEWDKAAKTYKKFYQQVKVSKETEEAGKIFQEQFLRYINLLAFYDEGMKAVFAKLKPANGLFYSLTETSAASRGIDVREVLEMTVPEFETESADKYLLSRIERALVVMLADTLVSDDNEENKKEGMELFRKILRSMETYLADEEEMRYQYPRIASLAVRCFAIAGNYEETWISSKGKEILLRNRRVVELDTFLRYEAEAAELRGDVEVRKELLEQIQLLEEVNIARPDNATEGGWKMRKFSAFMELAESGFNGIALGARIKRVREEKGMTQNELADGICSQRSIVRLENGHGRPHPFILHALLERLGQGTKRYFSDIVSNDYRMHECKWNMTASIAVMDYEQAEKFMNVLEYNLDEDEITNRQALLAYRTLIDSKIKDISYEEVEKRYREALSISVPENTHIENWPLKKRETVLLNNIANIMNKAGKVYEAAELLKKVLVSCERYHMMSEENNPQYILTLYNLSSYIGNLGDYKMALELSNKGLELGLQSGAGETIAEFLYKTVWNQEMIYEQEGETELKKTCLKLFRQAYELAKVIDYKILAKHIAKHCKEVYKIEI